MATKPSTMYSTNPKMVNQGTSPKYAMDALEERVEARDNYNTCSYWDK